MQELISITTDEQGLSVVSARELFEFLGFDKSHWARWSKKNIVSNPFALEGTDWTGFALMANPLDKKSSASQPSEVFATMAKTSEGGRPTVDYAISLDFAKKLSMKAPTEKGEQVRQYFIEIEKTLKQVTAPRATEHLLIQALNQQIQLLTDNQLMIAQLRADVDSIQRGHQPINRLPVQPGAPGLPPVPNEQLRRRLRERINAYCAYHQADYSQTYTYLYKRLHDVYGVNVHRLNRVEGENLLDTIERYGRLGELYKLATNELIYPVGETGQAPQRKPTLDTMSEGDLQAILRRTFSQEGYLQYAQLRANLIEASEFVGLALAKSRAEIFIARAVKLGYLLKRWEPGQRYERYELNVERLTL